MKKYDILFVGGHHSSAVPIIKQLKEKDLSLKFIGHKYASVVNNEISSEYKEISALGITYINLTAPKFYNVSGISKYFKLLKSLTYCFFLLFKDRPKLVFSFGGYLAVPVSIAAKLLFIKVITHEQTLASGLANKIVSRISDKVLLTWPLQNQSAKSEVVGIPLRSEVKSVPIKKLGPNYKIKTIFVQGGKQGSHLLNKFIFDNIDTLCKDYNIVHQTAKHSANNDYEMSKAYEKKYPNKYKSFDFIFGKDYTKVLSDADLLVSRSGAHITYEASFLKIPSIFVPIPWVSGNEQHLNAVNAKKFTPCVEIIESDLSLKSFNEAILQIKTILKKPNTFLKVQEEANFKIVNILLEFLK